MAGTTFGMAVSKRLVILTARDGRPPAMVGASPSGASSELCNERAYVADASAASLRECYPVSRSSGDSAVMGWDSNVVTDTPRLPFGPSRDQRLRYGVAWLLVARRGHGRRLASWLAGSKGATSRPYLVDIADGAIRFGATDVVIVMEPGSGHGVIHASTLATDEEIQDLIGSLQDAALPTEILGASPKVVDAALIRFSGGARQQEPNLQIRSALELDLDRLCTARFRDNAVTARKVSERALADTALSLLLQGVFHRARAEALESLAADPTGDDGVPHDHVVDAFTSASAAFLAAGYHRAAKESSQAANRVAARDVRQGELFDRGASSERERHRLGIAVLPCAALAVTFATTSPTFDRRLGKSPVDCDLEERGRVRIEVAKLRKWVLGSRSDTMVPNIRIDRAPSGEPLSLVMALTSEMAAMLDVMPDASVGASESETKWLVIPQLSARCFNPSSASVAPNEAVEFKVARPEPGASEQLTMTLLTPGRGPATILLPHTL